MQAITDLIQTALAELDLTMVQYSIEHPKDEQHGDYSVNVAMILSKQMGQNPRELAEGIVKQLTANGLQHTVVEKVEVAGPGFINFYLKKEYLLKELELAVDVGYGSTNSLKGQKTYVEFTDPNPFKEFHIGHLMSNTIGESLARILEANGATVKRANYQGDVGLHVAKSIWGWQKKMEQDGKKLQDLEGVSLKERIEYLGQAYAYGATKYEEDPPVGEAGETVKTEIQALNKEIYYGLAKKGTDPTRTLLVGSVMELYQAGRAWSLEYFETIYQRLGTKFEEYFFESEEGPKGLKIVEEGLKKGILEVGEGSAVVFKGEKYGLHTRVFRNKLGLPTYEAKELALPISKYERWAYDKSFIITANEINEYFKVLLKVLSLVNPQLGASTTHLSHGMMKLTTGKMSSRTGQVITGEGLLNELKDVVLAKMGERSFDSAQDKEVIADQVAVGALKYTVLKQAIGGDITYEPEKITNLEGDTGPYLQYTHARTVSVLKKAKANQIVSDEYATHELSELELKLLKWIYRYPEVVKQAGEKYAPHMIASYIYELSQRFNSFYNKEQIVGNPLRIRLTQVVGMTLERGLNLLGIVAPGEM